MITGSAVPLSKVFKSITYLLFRECPLTLCAERGYFELISLLLERYCLSV